MRSTIAIPVTVHPTPELLGRSVAQRILAGIERAAEENRPYLLGSPAGRSAVPVYAALGALAGMTKFDLSRLVLVMMDEYLVEGPDPGHPVLCDPRAHYSCRRFAEQEIRAVLNAKLPGPRQMPAAGVWCPAPAEPETYDRRIRDAGGIDLFLLASGASDGHVAFNPPGSPAEAGTGIVALAEETRRDNMATFPGFAAIAEVPRRGVSVGLGTIAGLSRAALMILHGAHKRQAVRRLLESRDFEPAWPATILHRCRHPEIHLDDAAAREAT
ncbi:6-phosphogluconolactonase [Inquilinus sp.]|jgi:glucosamine-6-phosphate deaminase|uniref:6-phosphogluconolactonase n=1 Tax=Inquilinus sp. TaxID=1932117 RepID=UPI00378501C5